MIQEEVNKDAQTQTLKNLGLTFLQATVYLGLAKLGKANAQRIANTSKVARPVIYQVMPTLQKMGLANKILNKTTLYEATPINEGLALLLQNKKEEYAHLEKEASSFLSSFPVNNLKDLQFEDQEFKIISEMRTLSKIHERLFESTLKSVDLVLPALIAQKLILNQEMLSKKARIRLVTQKVEKKAQSRKIEVLARKLDIELKYISGCAPFGMAIFDEKELTLCLCEPYGLPSLWSSNRNVLQIANAYFEYIWKRNPMSLKPIIHK
jgi:sugar-specific transcriptional regulator TrmB